MNVPECIEELEELNSIIQERIDSAVSEHKYEKSAIYRDLKKEVDRQISKLKKKQI
jgi:hypothetical protein